MPKWLDWRFWYAGNFAAFFSSKLTVIFHWPFSSLNFHSTTKNIRLSLCFCRWWIAVYGEIFLLSDDQGSWSVLQFLNTQPAQKEKVKKKNIYDSHKMFKLILEMFFLYLVLFPPGRNITTSVLKTVYFYLYLVSTAFPRQKVTQFLPLGSCHDLLTLTHLTTYSQAACNPSVPTSTCTRVSIPLFHNNHSWVRFSWMGFPRRGHISSGMKTFLRDLICAGDCIRDQT